MKTTIRRAKITDLTTILNLNQQLFKYEQQYTNQYNQKWTRSDPGKQYFKTALSLTASLTSI